MPWRRCWGAIRGYHYTIQHPKQHQHQRVRATERRYPDTHCYQQGANTIPPQLVVWAMFSVLAMLVVLGIITPNTGTVRVGNDSSR